MLGELIAIGDELTSGRVLNTTSHFAAAKLFAAGHEILAMTTIGDNPDLIGSSLQRALDRADFVLITGGLGPTSDDLTNAAVSSALDRPPTLYPEILRKIQKYSGNVSSFERQSLEKLAWLPAGAHALHSEAKTAGYFLVENGKPVFFLPGVPHEMQELLTETVIGRLAIWDGKEVRRVRQGLYRLVGLAESEINQRLADLETCDPRVRIGYYPVFPEVHLSLTVSAADDPELAHLWTCCSERIEALLGPAIYGQDAETLEGVVGALLHKKGRTLALAESCTGGLIAHRITSVAGSSGWFLGGAVTYSNQLKEQLLGVEPEILRDHGAVSPECVRAMAEGVRRLCAADFGLAVSGIAGPGGGSLEKPVGRVHFALASAAETKDFLFHFTGERWQIQALAAQTGLDLLRRHLLGLDNDRRTV